MPPDPSTSPAPRAIALQALLACGVAVPAVYFGLQIAAAPFFPDYDWIRNTASDLGSTDLPHHRAFNVGVLTLAGVIAFATAGFWAALTRTGTRAWLAALVTIALLGMSVQTAWAGWFPAPDPRHGGHPAFVIAMLATPTLLTLAMWRRSGRALRTYFALSLLVLAAMVPIMSGLIPFDRGASAGLLQRILTATIFIPIGVAAAKLMQTRRLQLSAGGQPKENLA
ncbi:MAG: DUF998 domain-containing protein [Phycisphaerales bacterium]